MPRQQRDFAREHAQFRAARTARCGRRGLLHRGRGGDVRQSRQHIVDRAAKIDFDRTAGSAIEDKNGRIVAPIERLFRRARDLAEVAGRDVAVTVEGNVSGVETRIHGKLLKFCGQYYPGILILSITSG